MDQIERLVHKLLRQVQVSNVLHDTGRPFARCAPVFWTNHHRDVWVKFFHANFPSPDGKFCIKPPSDHPSALVRGWETAAVVESVATGVDFDLLTCSFFPEFPIKVFDEISLQ